MAKRFRNAIGPQMRKLRFNRDWTQDQLAAKLQLAGLEFDRVAVAKIESQIRSVYDFELVVIAQVLGVALVDLLPSFSELDSDLSDLVAGRQKS
tara:strand:+ start:1559 stop:1840 length:282 start_codon:yes stop_codon:yes gene_type:complete